MSADFWYGLLAGSLFVVILLLGRTILEMIACSAILVCEVLTDPIRDALANRRYRRDEEKARAAAWELVKDNPPEPYTVRFPVYTISQIADWDYTGSEGHLARYKDKWPLVASEVGYPTGHPLKATIEYNPGYDENDPTSKYADIAVEGRIIRRTLPSETGQPR